MGETFVAPMGEKSHWAKNPTAPLRKFALFWARLITVTLERGSTPFGPQSLVQCGVWVDARASSRQNAAVGFGPLIKFLEGQMRR